MPGVFFCLALFCFFKSNLYHSAPSRWKSSRSSVFLLVGFEIETLICSPDLHEIWDSSVSVLRVPKVQVCATTLSFRTAVQYGKPTPRQICLRCLLLCPWTSTGTQKKEGLDVEKQLFTCLQRTLISHLSL